MLFPGSGTSVLDSNQLGEEMITRDKNELEFDDGGATSFERLPYTGRAEWRDRNGILRNSREYAEGLEHGLQQDWHPNGRLAMEETTCCHQLHGYRREWYSNGQLKCELLAEHGIRFISKYWDEAGNLVKAVDHEVTQQWLDILHKERAKARAAGYGPPPGVDPALLPP